MFKKFLIAAGIAIAVLAPTIAKADQPLSLHCPDGGTKTEANEGNQTEINNLLLDEGILVCVKAGPGNTGIVEADGESTLQGLLFKYDIIDGSEEQGRDVSYYVLYDETTTTTTTTEPTTTTTTEPTTTTTTAPPTVSDTPTDTATQTVTTVVEAVSAPTSIPAPIEQLPRTGAGVILLSSIGLSLTGIGMLLRKFKA